MSDAVVEQASVMTCPNQVWFPHVLKYEAKPNSNEVYIDIVTDVEPQPGDQYTDANYRVVSVIKIVDQHKAKGNWKGKFWKGVKPTWYRCLGEKVNRVIPAKKDE